MAKLALIGLFASVSPSRMSRRIAGIESEKSSYHVHCILSIIVCHVAMVLIQWIREKAVKRKHYLLSAMFLEGLLNEWNLEYGMGKSQSFKCRLLEYSFFICGKTFLI